jgi:hypothetical protein
MAISLLMSLIPMLSVHPCVQDVDARKVVITLQWTSDLGTTLELDQRALSRDELAGMLPSARAEDAQPPVVVDAKSEVPWGDVLGVVRTCRQRRLPTEFRYGEKTFPDELRAASVLADRIVRVVEPHGDDEVEAPVQVRVVHAAADVAPCAAYFDQAQACGELGHWRVEIESSVRVAQGDRTPLRTALFGEAAKQKDARNPLLSGRRVHIEGGALAPYGFTRWILEQSAAAGVFRFELADGSGNVLPHQLPISEDLQRK